MLPQSCTVALKEWATVLEALSRGEQHVLIRKGGLIEPGSGFKVQSNVFLFYPTFEHQAINYLRPEFRSYFDQALTHRAPEGHVRFELCGLALSSVASHDGGLIERLGSHHIYNQEFLTQRLKWQPDQPLMIVIVRAFRLPRPVTIPILPSYAGCKSWVALDTSISLEGAQPILGEERFQGLFDTIKRIC